MNMVTKLLIPLTTLLHALALVGCGDTSADEAARPTSSPVRAVQVQVQEVQPQPFIETLQLSCSIKAFEDIVVAPEEGGIVKEWKFEKGARVRKGEIIVQLNDDVLKPGYESALAQYHSAELTFEKQQKVYSEQAVSEWQLKTAEFNRDAARAQADLMRARWERTRIKSPIDGILDERYVDEGEMASPGAPIARIVNIRSVKAVVNVPERYAGRIKLGSPIQLTVLAYPGEVFRGRIMYIGSAISPDNRTFPVEALLSNPGGKLKPEMIAKVQLALSVQPDALLVDESIVQQIDRNKFVLYVANNGKAQERHVQLGGRQGTLVQILSGLKPGDRVITRGFRDVSAEQPVIIMPPDEEKDSGPVR
jgi:membrane fusion protein (multidrug efflux system)